MAEFFSKKIPRALISNFFAYSGRQYKGLCRKNNVEEISYFYRPGMIKDWAPILLLSLKKGLPGAA
jgi:hypothetical protein